MTKLLFDRISAEMIPMALADKSIPEDMRAGIAKTYREATVFVNDDALRQILDGEVSIDDLPSFAPPYDAFFIESNAPSSEKRTRTPGNDGDVIFNFGARVGGLFFPCDMVNGSYEGEGWVEGCVPVDNTVLRWRYEINLFLETPNLDYMLFATAVIMLDNLGKPIAVMKDEQIGYSYIQLEETFKETLRINSPRGQDYDFAFDHWYEYAGMALNACMFTIGMLHCRNIGTEEFEPRASENHKYRKKNGFPMHRYHVLKITGKGKDAGELIGVATGRHNKLHWVRAHWRTYTDAAPLFGNITGTFYVSPFIRGDITRGTVTKDYKVEIKDNGGQN